MPVAWEEFVKQYPAYAKERDNPEFRSFIKEKGVDIEPLRMDRGAFFSQYPQYQEEYGKRKFEEFLRREKGIDLAPVETALTQGEPPEPSLIQRLFGTKPKETITPAEKAAAQIEVEAKQAGKPVPKYKEAVSPEYRTRRILGVPGQAAAGAVNIAALGIPEAVLENFLDMKMPKPEGPIEEVARGAGELGGFIAGAPVKIGKAATEKALGGILKTTEATGKAAIIGKKVVEGAATLGVASGAAAAGQALNEKSISDAIRTEWEAVKSGALTGAVFGGAGLFNFRNMPTASRIARIGLGTALLDYMHGTNPLDDRALAQKAFDYGLNALFLWRGRNPRQIQEDMVRLSQLQDQPFAETLKNVLDRAETTGKTPEETLQETINRVTGVTRGEDVAGRAERAESAKEAFESPEGGALIWEWNKKVANQIFEQQTTEAQKQRYEDIKAAFKNFTDPFFKPPIWLSKTNADELMKIRQEILRGPKGNRFEQIKILQDWLDEVIRAKHENREPKRPEVKTGIKPEAEKQFTPREDVLKGRFGTTADEPAMRAAVEAGGGEFVGVQYDLSGRPISVHYDPPGTHATITHELKDLTPENVKRRIADKLAEFRKGTRPSEAFSAGESIPFMPGAYKKYERHTGSKSLARIVVEAGGLKHHEGDTPGGIREEVSGVPKWLLRRNGMAPDEMVSHLQEHGYPHIQSENDLIQALRDEYDSITKTDWEEAMGEKPPGVQEPRLTRYGSDDIQKQIDAMEGELERQGVDISRLYDPSERKPGDLPSDWRPMPNKLAQLYKQRDKTDRADLAQSIDDIKRFLRASKADIPEADAILRDIFALDPMSEAGIYMAAKYTRNMASDSETLNRVYLRIAAMRDLLGNSPEIRVSLDRNGEASLRIGSPREIDNKVLVDTIRLVDAVQAYFTGRPAAYRDALYRGDPALYERLGLGVGESQRDLFGGPDKEIKGKKKRPEQQEMFRPEFEDRTIKAEGVRKEDAEDLLGQAEREAQAKAEAEFKKKQSDLFGEESPPKGWGSKDPAESRENPHTWDAADASSTVPEGMAREYSRVETEFYEKGFITTSRIKVNTPDDVAWLAKNWAHEKQENIYAIYLDRNGNIMEAQHFAIGSFDRAALNSSDVAGSAKLRGAHSVYLVHNHPSWNPKPSKEDVDVTSSVEKALSDVGIVLKGHVVVDGPEHYGFIGADKTVNIGNLPGEGPGPAQPVRIIGQRMRISERSRPLRDPADVSRYLRGLSGGPKVLFLDTDLNVNAVYALSSSVRDPAFIGKLRELTSLHAGNRIIITALTMRPSDAALLKLRLKGVDGIDLLDVINITPMGFESILARDTGRPYGSKADESYMRDSGPAYDSLRKDRDFTESGRERGFDLKRAMEALKFSMRLKRPDDLNKFDNIIATPVFIGEKHKAFAPLPKRAIEMAFETDEIMSRMAELVKPYQELPERSKRQVNRTLIEGSLARKVLTDEQLRSAGLSPEQIRAYRAVRSAFDAALDEIKKMTVSLHGGQEKLSDIFDEIEQAKREGYVPFSRFGRWAYGIKNRQTGEMIHFGMAENRFTASREWLDLRDQYEKELASGAFEAVEPHKLPKRYTQSLIGDIDPFTLRMLSKLAKVDPAVADDFIKQTEEFFKTRGFKKHFIRRKDIPGFSADLERSIADYMIGTARYVARLKGIHDLKNLAQAIDPVRQPELAQYADRYIDYLSRPHEEFSRFRSGMFFYYLGANVKSFVVNLTQPATTTLPWLSQYAPSAIVSKEMLQAQKDVLRAIGWGPGGVPELKMEKLPADVREAARTALREGVISEQLIYELMGLARGQSTLTRAIEPRVRDAIRMAGFLFSTAEKNNRLITFIAAHRLYGRSKKASGAFRNEMDFATDVVNKTQFIYMRANRPRLARKYGAPFFIFRSFTINYIEMMRRLSDDPAAFSMAAGILFGLGGLMGLPFAEDAKDLAQGAYKSLTTRRISLEHEARKWVSKWVKNPRIADVLLHGMSRATPIDLGGSLSVGDVLPGTGGLEAEHPVEEAAYEVAGIPGDIVRRAGRGLRLLRRGEYGRAAETVSPEFIRNPLFAIRAAREGVRSVTGETVLPKGELKPYELVGKGFGFQPSKLSREYARSEFERTLRLSAQEAQSTFVERAARAYSSGDPKKVQEVIRDLEAYNRGKKPSDRVVLTQAIIKRKLAQMQTPKGLAVLRSLPRKARPEYAEESELYE